MQLKAYWGELSRGAPKSTNINAVSTRSHAAQQTPTLQRTITEITTKCKAFENKQIEVQVANTTREKPDGAHISLNTQRGISQEEEQIGGKEW